MSEFEKIHFEAINCDGVYFGVEENEMLAVLDGQFRGCDIIMFNKFIPRALFGNIEDFEAFARKRGFKTTWDWYQCLYVCEKEPPWIE